MFQERHSLFFCIFQGSRVWMKMLTEDHYYYLQAFNNFLTNGIAILVLTRWWWAGGIWLVFWHLIRPRIGGPFIGLARLLPRYSDHCSQWFSHRSIEIDHTLSIHFGSSVPTSMVSHTTSVTNADVTGEHQNQGIETAHFCFLSVTFKIVKYGVFGSSLLVKCC